MQLDRRLYDFRGVATPPRGGEKRGESGGLAPRENYKTCLTPSKFNFT